MRNRAFGKNASFLLDSFPLIVLALTRLGSANNFATAYPTLLPALGLDPRPLERGCLSLLTGLEATDLPASLLFPLILCRVKVWVVGRIYSGRPQWCHPQVTLGVAL
jgi:hypothetical protein